MRNPVLFGITATVAWAAGVVLKFQAGEIELAFQIFLMGGLTLIVVSCGILFLRHEARSDAREKEQQELTARIGAYCWRDGTTRRADGLQEHPSANMPMGWLAGTVVSVSLISVAVFALLYSSLFLAAGFTTGAGIFGLIGGFCLRALR